LELSVAIRESGRRTIGEKAAIVRTGEKAAIRGGENIRSAKIGRPRRCKQRAIAELRHRASPDQQT
jgi:hypothetical protein